MNNMINKIYITTKGFEVDMWSSKDSGFCRNQYNLSVNNLLSVWNIPACFEGIVTFKDFVSLIKNDKDTLHAIECITDSHISAYLDELDTSVVDDTVTIDAIEAYKYVTVCQYLKHNENIIDNTAYVRGIKSDGSECSLIITNWNCLSKAKMMIKDGCNFTLISHKGENSNYKETNIKCEHSLTFGELLHGVFNTIAFFTSPQNRPVVHEVTFNEETQDVESTNCKLDNKECVYNTCGVCVNCDCHRHPL